MDIHTLLKLVIERKALPLFLRDNIDLFFWHTSLLLG